MLVRRVHSLVACCVKFETGVPGTGICRVAHYSSGDGNALTKDDMDSDNALGRKCCFFCNFHGGNLDDKWELLNYFEQMWPLKYFPKVGSFLIRRLIEAGISPCIFRRAMYRPQQRQRQSTRQMQRQRQRQKHRLLPKSLLSRFIIISPLLLVRNSWVALCMQG